MNNVGRFKGRRRFQLDHAQAYFGRYLEGVFSYVFDVGSRDLLSVLGAFTLESGPQSGHALASAGERRRFAERRATEVRWG